MKLGTLTIPRKKCCSLKKIVLLHLENILLIEPNYFLLNLPNTLYLRAWNTYHMFATISQKFSAKKMYNCGHEPWI